MSKTTFTTGKLAEITDAAVYGSKDVVIDSVRAVDCAASTSITFAGEDKYIRGLCGCKAGAVIVPRKVEGIEMVQLVVDSVDAALIAVLEAFSPKMKFEGGVHEAAFVSKTAKIGEGTYIGAFAFIDDDVVIGENSYIDAGAVIKRGCRIGNSSRIDANVCVYHNCTIGNNCIIQSATVIGSDGFGYRSIGEMPKLIPHNGGVVLEDFVELGANCCIDRGKFGDTVIGMGTKIDNLVQIAHNCKLGKCCLLAAQVGIAGSTTIGNDVIMGGQSGVTEHMNVADGVRIAGRAGITGPTTPGATMYGFPAREYRQAMRTVSQLKNLDQTVKKVKELEKKVAKLDQTDDNSK